MIRHWVVLDLDVFRRHEGDPLVRRETQDNGDGTYFNAYDILSFPPELVVAKSPTMAIAFEHGVAAVRPLQPKTDLNAHWSRTDPPPDLQALVLRFGGYDKIPAAAWAGFDQLMANWKERRR